MPDPLSPVIITTSGAAPPFAFGFRFAAISDALQFSLESSAIQAQTKRSAIKVIGSFVITNLRHASRLDQPKVSILTFVKHAETVCIRVAKDNELIIAARQFQGGLFGRHR